MQRIRIAATASQADEWALVLTAAGIPNTVEADASGWAVLADDTVRAHGLLLLWSFTVTGTPAAGSPWFERGAAAAGRILAGEPWRAVTALTLHADVVHVVGNAVA